jgi:hypothetical protein
VPYLARRYIVPLALMFAGLTGFLLWVSLHRTRPAPRRPRGLPRGHKRPPSRPSRRGIDGRRRAARARVAGIAQETRAENYLRVRAMRARRRLYAWRSARGLPQLYPALWSGVLSSPELASLWQLPTLRLKGVPVHRISAREIAASSAISRDPSHAIMYDEHGPVGIRPQDRRKGLMFLGAAGAGKSTALARHLASLAHDTSRALIIIDPKEDLARQALGLIPTERTVYYLDLGKPRYGLNILSCGDLTPEVRADTFISILRELGGEASVGARSDMYLRAAIQAAVIVEHAPTLQHVAALLDLHDSGYREWVIRELHYHHEIDYLRSYWQHTFPREVKDSPRFVAEALTAPKNKLARFIGTPALSLLMTHPPPARPAEHHRSARCAGCQRQQGCRGGGERQPRLRDAMCPHSEDPPPATTQEPQRAPWRRLAHRRGTQRIHAEFRDAAFRGTLRRA